MQAHKSKQKACEKHGLGPKVHGAKAASGMVEKFHMQPLRLSCMSAHSAFKTSVKVRQFGRPCCVVQLVIIRCLTHEISTFARTFPTFSHRCICMPVNSRAWVRMQTGGKEWNFRLIPLNSGCIRSGAMDASTIKCRSSG